METLSVIAAEIVSCEKCPLNRSRTNAVPGEGPTSARIFLIGEAPGRDEDEQGRPFVGRSGKLLTELLREAGIDRRGVFITSSLKCRPPRNRNPKVLELDTCRPYLHRQIAVVKPRIIVTLGSFGLKALFGRSKELVSCRGKVLRFNGIPVLSTYHPAAITYNRRIRNKIIGDLRKAARLVVK